MAQLGQFLPFLLMFVVIYFFMIKPQQTRAKKEKMNVRISKIMASILTL